MQRILLLLSTLALCVPMSYSTGVAGTQTTTLILQPIVSDLDEPVFVISAPGSVDTFFVGEKRGRVRIVKNGTLLRRRLVDLDDIVSSKGDHGLLDLAFPSDFYQSRQFYVMYSDRQGDLVVARLLADKDDHADEEEQQIILKVVQPSPHQRKGSLSFGQDGFLYIGVGDGGRVPDTDANLAASANGTNNAQNMRSLLGKIVRIDVSKGGYTIPIDNPFVGQNESLPEIWASGFRDPTKISFDPATGALLVTDSGSPRGDEINVVTRGANYGWNNYEGSLCVNPSCSSTLDQSSTARNTPPIAESSGVHGTSFTRGAFYRGHLVPSLKNTYLFAESKEGLILGLRLEALGWTQTELVGTQEKIVSLNGGPSGEIYVVTQAGSIFRIGAQGSVTQ
jgi:glucose/arabinose dehydrogenase